jgi:DNA-binding PadR family transcriptional regulator
MRPIAWLLKRQKHGISIYSELILDKLTFIEQHITDLLDWSERYQVASLATTHRAIHDLEKIGFITIKQSKQDKRVKIARITIKGRRYLEEV